MLRTAGSAALVLILLVLTWYAGCSGFSSLLTAYAAQSSQLGPTQLAVNLDPGNPDSHYMRATILEAFDLPAAISEHQQAALARPEDYALWLSLARARELNGDTAGAIAAARQAVLLAPYYAQPHYQLGNILVRAGQTEEAFRELRLAGASNPTLLPGVIDLAWRVFGGDVEFVERAIEPSTPEAYQALGQFFRQHQEVDAAVAMYAAAGKAAEEDRRSFLAELITAKRFKEAANLWAVGRQTGAVKGVIVDPGFEEEINLYEPGFSWRVGDRIQGFKLSLDTTNPREGHTSLKIEFTGDQDFAAPPISQLVLVEPRAHYQMRFAVRSENILSGGLPEVVVFDADTRKVLGQSGELPLSTNGWRDYSIDFEVGDATAAVQIAIQRRRCDRSPCPIFGRLWLDGFSLQKL